MWFGSNRRQERVVHRPELASENDRRAVFLEWHDHFFWTAFLITGSSDAAERAVVDASELAGNANTVFQDWMVRWAREATARAAIDSVRDLISAASSQYVVISCAHGYHEPLTSDQIDTLRQLPIELVQRELDVFARSVLVLRGIHQNSTASCARSLFVQRSRVGGAYCHVMQWFENLTSRPSVLKED